MSDTGELIWRAEQAGDFYCEVCDKRVFLDDPKGYDETREQVLEHHRENHDL